MAPSMEMLTSLLLVFSLSNPFAFCRMSLVFCVWLWEGKPPHRELPSYACVLFFNGHLMALQTLLLNPEFGSYMLHFVFGCCLPMATGPARTSRFGCFAMLAALFWD
jgi:hypothetical protein